MATQLADWACSWVGGWVNGGAGHHVGLWLAGQMAGWFLGQALRVAGWAQEYLLPGPGSVFRHPVPVLYHM